MDYRFEWCDYEFQCKFNSIAPRAKASLLLRIAKGEEYTLILVTIVTQINQEDFFNLIVNYREANTTETRNFLNRKTSDEDILIARTIDKILRAPLQSITKDAISLNCLLLKRGKNLDPMLAAIYGAILVTKTLWPINIGAVALGLKEQQTVYLPDKDNMRLYLLVAANGKGEIFHISLECAPGIDVETHINKSIKICAQFKSILSKIPSLYGQEIIPQSKNPLPFHRTRKDLEARKTTLCYDSIPNGILAQRGNTVLAVFAVKNTSSELLQVKYNFPSYATGSFTGKSGNRREIGHGILISRGLKHILTSKEPLGLTTEIFSADGSTSMLSVQAFSYHLYNLGYSDTLIAGVSLGLIRENDRERIIVDMEAEEDAISEVDFKITGNAKDITSITMDTKSYLPQNKIKEILQIAKKTLKKLLETKPKPFIEFEIGNLGLLIGSQGKNIKFIEQFTGSKIITSQSGKVRLLGSELASYFLRYYAKEWKTGWLIVAPIQLEEAETTNRPLLKTPHGIYKISNLPSIQKHRMLIMKITSLKDKRCKFMEFVK